MSAVNLSADSFWYYSIDVYLREDVAMHALALQDNHGVNVNLLLLLCWCLDHGVLLNLVQFNALKKAIAKSEASLKAHRDKRRQAHPDKGGTKESYDMLKAQELTLERVQQGELVDTFNGFASVMHLPDAGSVVNASLAAFINACQLKDNDAARHHLKRIVNQL